MPYEFCRQIKANGRRCGSPALIDENWCFFHHRLHFRRRSLREAVPKDAKPQLLLIPPLEDREAIQVALSLVVEGVAAGTIEGKVAGILLRGLSIASRNSMNITTEPHEDTLVRSFIPTPDGMELATRAMSNGSTPPPRPDRPPTP